MGYDISADYVDSTTYEPRSTIMDPEFIGHGNSNDHVGVGKKHQLKQSSHLFVFNLILIVYYLFHYYALSSKSLYTISSPVHMYPVPGTRYQIPGTYV